MKLSLFILATMILLGCTQAPLPAGAEDSALSPEKRLEPVIEQHQANAWPGITSITVSIDGETLIESYSEGLSATDKHDLRSATKSVTAILVSELLEDGLIKSTDETLASLIPERFLTFSSDNPKHSLRVDDLLTMRTGLACDDWVPASLGHEDKMYKTSDWVGFFLSQPPAHERGQHFSYCTGGVVLLGELIARRSGQSVSDFAQDRLFTPLGITSATWAKTPEGGTDTGGHLELTAPDFHKIGHLILDNPGEIISPDWLSQMIGYQTEVYERRSTYGYLWWRNTVEIEGQPIPYVYAHGNGGNFLFIVPDLDLVASFTGTNYGSRLQFQPVAVLHEHILPAIATSE